MSWNFNTNQAESYEAYLVPTIFVPFTEALISSAGLRSGERVLDVACGTGIVSRMAAPIVGNSRSVVGLDIDRGMLEVARSASTAQAGVIQWVQGDVASMPLENASFDVVLCQAALQFFPDRQAALREIGRVLASTGRLILSCFCAIERNPAFDALASALQRYVGSEAAAMRHAIFAVGKLEELLGMLNKAGFNDNHPSLLRTTVQFPSPEDFLIRQIASQSPWLISQLDQATRVALVDEIDSSLADFVDGDGLAFPMEAHVVEAFRRVE